MWLTEVRPRLSVASPCQTSYVTETDGEIVAYRLVSNPNPSGATFTPTALRLLAAADRCTAIDNLLNEFSSEWTKHLHPRARAEDPLGTVELSFEGTGAALAELGGKATTLASEALHHARTALDYIAYHAAWSDGGDPEKRTQFPLAGTEAEWVQNLKSGWLKGVSPEQVLWIKEVQPLRIVKWSSNLKRLSNQDKHRVAVDIWPTYEVEFPRHSRTADPLGDPAYVGFNVTKREIGLLIGDVRSRVDGQEGVDALALLWDIVRGVMGVANRFLVAEGSEPMQMTDSERVGT